MAKQPRVWDGSQWQELAVTLPDLSNYSTTTQMNTAIDGKSTGVVLSSGAFTTASSVSLSNFLSSTYTFYQLVVYATCSGVEEFRMRFRENTTDVTTGYYSGSASANTSGTVANYRPVNNGGYFNIGDIGSSQFVFNMTIYRPSATVGAINWNGFAPQNSAAFFAAGNRTSMTNFTGLTFYPANNSITGYYTLIGIKG